LYVNDFASETCDNSDTKLAHDFEKIEMNIDDVDNNHTILFGASNGWESPTTPEEWKPLSRQLNDNKQLLADVNNPGE
jgi:hypothetical protein